MELRDIPNVWYAHLAQIMVRNVQWVCELHNSQNTVVVPLLFSSN